MKKKDDLNQDDKSKIIKLDINKCGAIAKTEHFFLYLTLLEEMKNKKNKIKIKQNSNINSKYTSTNSLFFSPSVNSANARSHWYSLYKSCLVEKNKFYDIPLIIHKYIEKKAENKYLELMKEAFKLKKNLDDYLQFFVFQAMKMHRILYPEVNRRAQKRRTGFMLKVNNKNFRYFDNLVKTKKILDLKQIAIFKLCRVPTLIRSMDEENLKKLEEYNEKTEKNKIKQQIEQVKLTAGVPTKNYFREVEKIVEKIHVGKSLDLIKLNKNKFKFVKSKLLDDKHKIDFDKKENSVEKKIFLRRNEFRKVNSNKSNHLNNHSLSLGRSELENSKEIKISNLSKYKTASKNLTLSPNPSVELSRNLEHKWQTYVNTTNSTLMNIKDDSQYKTLEYIRINTISPERNAKITTEANETRTIVIEDLKKKYGLPIIKREKHSSAIKLQTKFAFSPNKINNVNRTFYYK